MKSIVRALPYIAVYGILGAAIVAIVLWPQREELVEEDALQQEVMATVKAVERAAINLDNTLLKIRAGLLTDHKMLNIVGDEMRAHKDTLEYYAKDPILSQFPPFLRLVEQTSELVNAKYNAAMRFNQNNAQLANSIIRGQQLGEQVAEVVVESANLDVIEKLDLIYQLNDRLNRWVMFNREDDANFILQNIGKINGLNQQFGPDQNRIISSYTKGLNTIVTRQRKTNQLIEDAIAQRPINPSRFRQSMSDKTIEDMTEKKMDLSKPAIIGIFVIAVLTNLLQTVISLGQTQQQLREKQFLRDKQAATLRLMRKSLRGISERLQHASTGYKHYQLLKQISTKIQKRILEPSSGNKKDLAELIKEFRMRSRQVGDKEVQMALIECTSVLDDFETSMADLRHQQFEDSSLIANMIEGASELKRRGQALKGGSKKDKKPDDKPSDFITV